MKCPKCGYNSFEYYDNCKKCSNDLTGYKLTYSISSMVLPLEVKARMAAEKNSAKPGDGASAVVAENNADMFAFNEADDSTATSVVNDDPFNFDEPVTAGVKTGVDKTDFDPFADLLEATSHADSTQFAGAGGSVISTDAHADATAPGEFELDSFSWDEGAPAKDSGEDTGTEDDFDSFFGDLKETTTK